MIGTPVPVTGTPPHQPGRGPGQDPAGACTVWSAPALERHRALARLLDDAERARWVRITSRPAQQVFLTAHALARVVAGQMLQVPPQEVEIGAVCVHCAGPHGRPVARAPGGGPCVRLSLSHSGERVVVAAVPGPPEGPAAWLGADVERVAIRGRSMPLGVLAAQERAQLRRLPGSQQLSGFIRYWTRKEAVLKATGQGLLVHPSSVVVSAPSQPPELLRWESKAVAPQSIHLSDLAAPPGYSASLAVLGGAKSVIETDATHLLDEPR